MQLTFAAGETTKTVTVLVNGDLFDELDEAYAVNLTDVVNAAAPDSQGLGTISDDDGLPSVSVSDVIVTEGSGSSNAVFTLSLNAPSGQPVDVDYVTADGSATAPADYTALPLTTITFAPGQVTRTVSVPIAADLLDEIDESFTLNLSNAVNATISDALGLGTITDNDPLPNLSVDDVTVTEGDAGTVSAIFTVTLNTVSGRAVSVDYATANNTAVSPADYAAGGRDAHLRRRPGLEAGDGPGQRGRARRGQRDLLPQSHEPDQRDVRRRPGRGHDHRRRSGAGAFDRRRHRHRGQLRHDGRDLHGQPRRAQRPSRQRRLRNRRGHGDLAGRLRSGDRHRQLRGRRDDQDDHRCRQRRPDRRDRRDVRRQPFRPGQRDDHGRRRRGHDHG